MTRLFDLFCAAVGLLLLSPFFLVACAAIKLEDRGPVLFRQERVGRHGKPFRIFKFRTMRWEVEPDGLPITVGRDKRITRVGAWLRARKIDEFPQLLNVLVGDMGLVGPRPEVPRYVAHYTEDQRRVLALRPGITDAASIAYREENEILPRSEDPETFYIQHIMPNKIRINLEYAAGANLWTHFKVILATFGLLPPPVAVRQAGDLRAFDRIPLEQPVQVRNGGQPLGDAQPINISHGGVLLEPGSELPVGSACELSLTPDGPEGTKIEAEGVVIRTDDQGVAIRFSRPLADKTFKTFQAPD